MRWKSRFALLAGTAYVAHFVVAAPPRPVPAKPAAKIEQKVTGPIANYWMSAATSTGTGFGAMGMAGTGGGKRPSMGDMMRMMRGGGSQVQHNLTLQLGSNQAAVGDPRADHTPGSYQVLSLVTPRETAAPVPEETVEEQPTMPERPCGRMLIYWGCGEHAGPGQPLVIDFSKIGPGQPLPHFPYIAVHHQNPPAAGRYKTYGEWPNGRTQEEAPPLLAGPHSIHGTYSPDIRFTLPANRDYMPPLMIDASTRTAAGATMLAWQPVAGATGYFAAMFGASPGKEGEATVVMWSSSAQQTFAGGGLLDYLAPAEVRRLIAEKAVMPPEQTKCAIPTEVTGGAPMGMLSMIAYGEEANFADPPRPADPHVPWNISWTAKVRYKSTAGLMLGMPAIRGMGATPAAQQSGDAEASPAADDPPKKKKGGWMSKLRDAAGAVGAIPH
jgi:hypothetical protein